MTVSEYLNKKGIIYSKRDDEAICNCPFCDDTEDKFAINLTSGAFNCYHHNNCSIKGSFWDFQKKLGDTPKQLSGQNNFVSKRKKQFTQPEVEINELSPVCIRYLKKRGFSEKTIKHFKIGSHDKTTLMFPYYKNGKLVNVKYRSIIDKKTMWTEKDAEPTLFNRDNTYGKTLIICEGECFPPDAEILTPKGWVRFDKYDNEKVLQVFPNGLSEFVNPSTYVKKPFDGELIEYSVRGWELKTTPKHNLVSIDTHGKWYKHEAQQAPIGKVHTMPRVTQLNGGGIPLTNGQIMLAVAISADATIDVRKGTGNNFPKEKRYARFGFKKERKIERLRKILKICSIQSSDNKVKSEYQSICFPIPDYIPGRLFPFEWIEKATTKQRKLILRELIYWDGNYVPNRNQTEYCSKEPHNAVFVQTLAHTNGIVSTIIPCKNKYGSWFKVSLLYGKSYNSWQTVKRKDIPYKGLVYCITVPSGMILVRQNEKISVSGNCDAMALREYRYNAVSIPSGVSHFGWVDTEWDYLETFSEILLCFDNDDAGEQGARNVALKLGVWRCKLVVLPKKDANQCLIDEIPRKDIQKCFDNSMDMKPESLVRTTYFWEEIKELLDRGTDLFGLSTPWESLDNILKGWRGGEVTVWTGYNGAGKSTILNQVFIDAAKKEAKICIYSGEMPPKRYLRWALIQCVGSNNLSQEESWEHLFWMEDKVFIVNIAENIKPEKLLNDFEYAARRYDVTHFIIDSLMTVSFKNEDEYGEQKDFMNELCKFAQTHDVHVHLVAHPRKGAKDTDVPGKVDVKGTSHITDLAHNVIVMSRRDEESKQEARKKRKIPTDAKLYVKKNREFGNLGSIKLMFSEETKSYTEKRENFE